MSLLCGHSVPYSETWPSSGMMRDGAAYSLPTPERPTDAIASSLLPTPAASNPNDGETLESWQARRERVKARRINGNGFGMPLTIAVRLLPTPVASEAQKATQRQNAEQKSRTGQVWLSNVALTITERTGASTDLL